MGFGMVGRLTDPAVMAAGEAVADRVRGYTRVIDPISEIDGSNIGSAIERERGLSEGWSKLSVEKARVQGMRQSLGVDFLANIGKTLYANAAFVGLGIGIGMYLMYKIRR